MCRRPGCTGAIDEDGYCDLCGHRAAPAPSGVSAPGPEGVTASEPATRSGTTGRTGTGVLGAGLADLPPVPGRNPAEVVLTDPMVPEHSRFCGVCERPVGRGRDGRPGLTEGFCPYDGTPFSFTPKLAAGDVVAGQYEVKGCLAHGGVGWIHLAADRNLDGMWVVLKGLLNTTDTAALAAAEAEKRFLITVDHPNIVKILNFVQHRDPGAEATSGYLVMEYVDGVSLHDMLGRRRREQGAPLPLRQSIPYALEVLHAFDHLHQHGLLYCDLKPENLIQAGQRLKIIDLGAVRRIDDPYGDVWGTIGYQAPEIAESGPSVRSDLYTVGRTLAVLSLAFRPVVGGPGEPREAPLPAPAPGDNESFHRLLSRATEPDPDARFASAAEMADQLTGVLREVRAAEDGIPYPAQSRLFGPERGAAATALAAGSWQVLADLDATAAVAALPVPLADPADPAASALAGLVGRHPDELPALVESLPATPEALLARVRVMVEQGRPDAAAALDAAARELPGDWRVAWYRAVHLLATGHEGEAEPLFDRCLSRLPGECAPKLALGFTLERAGRLAGAARWYEALWRTDHGYVSAAFGLARTRPDAVGVLDQVPTSSSHHVAAQLALVAAPVRGSGRPEATELAAAGKRLAALDRLDQGQRAMMAAEVLLAALDRITTTGPDPQVTILGTPLTDAGIRLALERALRDLAHAAGNRTVRRMLVEHANMIRPRTWL